MSELGITRAAAEAIMRQLPLVQFEGLRKVYVRRDDVARLIETRTLQNDEVMPSHPRSLQRKRHNLDGMSLYYGYSSCYPSPFVVARYACRCGRIHTRHGAVRVSKVPPGWHVTSDLAGQPEPECARCHKETVARREAGA